MIAGHRPGRSTPRGRTARSCQPRRRTTFERDPSCPSPVPGRPATHPVPPARRKIHKQTKPRARCWGRRASDGPAVSGATMMLPQSSRHREIVPLLVVTLDAPSGPGGPTRPHGPAAPRSTLRTNHPRRRGLPTAGAGSVKAVGFQGAARSSQDPMRRSGTARDRMRLVPRVQLHDLRHTSLGTDP